MDFLGSLLALAAIMSLCLPPPRHGWRPRRSLLILAGVYLLMTDPALAGRGARRESSARRGSPDPAVETARGRVFEGHGLTAEEAKHDALRVAREEMAHLIRELHPGSSWNRLTVEDIQNVTSEVRTTPWEPPNELKPPAKVQYRAEVELGPNAPEELLRIVVARERQWLLIQAILAIAVLFGVIGGYYHVNRLTGGRHRGWLGLAAVATLGLAGLGILSLS